MTVGGAGMGERGVGYGIREESVFGKLLAC